MPGEARDGPQPARLSLAAFGGYALSYSIPVTGVSFGTGGGERVERDAELEGRTTFGLEAMKPLSSRMLWILGWTYESESSCDQEASDGACASALEAQGPSSVFHLAVGMAFREASPITVYAGPTWRTGDTAASSLGLVFGGVLDIPIPAVPLALRIGADDRLTFWENDDNLVDISGSVENGPSHLVSVRAGIAYWP